MGKEEYDIDINIESNDEDFIPFEKKKKIRELSFTKQISLMGGDNAKFSRKLMHLNNDKETFFAEALTKWNDQDYGLHYTSFVNDIPSGELQTYAQLLFHKETIITAWLKHMGNENNTSVVAFCELICALVRDLKEEIHSHMWEIFDCLFNVLDLGEKDLNGIEGGFFALTLLVKLLWRRIAKDVKKALVKFIPVFASSRSYVRRFAAESFAFILRKITDLKQASRFIVEQAFKLDQPKLTDGCSLLFFHVYRGIGGSFHSAAREYIRDILSGVMEIDDEATKEFGIEMIQKVVEETVEYVRRSKKGSLEILELTLLELLTGSGSMARTTSLCRLLPLCYVQIYNRELFPHKKKLFTTIQNILSADYFHVNHYFVDFLSKSIVNIFPADEYNLQVRTICDQVAQASDDNTLLIELFEALYTIPKFDLYIMPAVGRLAEKIIEQDAESPIITRLFLLYAAVCADRRPITQVIGRARSSFFDLAHHGSVKKLLISELSHLSKMKSDRVAAIITCWPYMFANIEKIQGINEVLSYLKEIIELKESDSRLVLLVASAIYQIAPKCLESLSEESMKDFVKRQSCCESAIRTYRLYVEVQGEQNDISKLLSTAELLETTFFNPISAVRLAAVEILSYYVVPLENNNDYNDTEPENVFRILADAERSPTNEFRLRAMHFRKLLYGAHLKSMPKGTTKKLENIILRIGLSQFFIQFTPIWKSMHELLSSFAHGMQIDEFWKIMAEVLNNINHGCRQNSSNTVFHTFPKLLGDVDANNRYDYLTARIEILKFIAIIPSIAERRTRVLSPLLIELYEKDYLRLTTDDAEKMFEKDQEKDEDHGEEEEGEEDDEEKDTKSPQEEEVLITKKQMTKALCAFLNIFSQFDDPKSVYLEPQLTTIYLNLLTMADSGIQKSAMKCILGYNNKAVVAYRENLELILEEKSLKDQLVLFKISDEDGDAILHEDHRSAVMPILLRVLYGKLQMKTKKKIATGRRIAIFRYLIGCRSNELSTFINILFSSLLQLTGDGEDCCEKMEEVCANKDILLNIDLRRLRQTLDCVSELVKRVCRTLEEEQVSLLFRLLLSSAVVLKSFILHPLKQQHLHTLLKELRMSIADRIKEFIQAFPNRVFHKKEVDCLLKYMIIPYLTEAKEGDDDTSNSLLIAPFSVIKMLTSFSKFPTFYHLYALRVPYSDRDCSVMDIMLNPLLWNGLTTVMLNTIRNGLQDMITMADEPYQIVEGMKYMDIPQIEDVNYGTRILVSHIEPLLRFLSKTIDEECKQKKICVQNLIILNRLSEFVSDGELGHRMADTLLAYMNKSIPKKDEITQQMFNTLARLLKLVHDPLVFLPKLPPLFSSVIGRSSRESLVQMSSGLSLNSSTPSDVKDILQVVTELESWDTKKLEEPDHDRRHAAYSKLLKIWNQDVKMEKSLFAIIVHSTFNTLLTLDDISLRASCASNLRLMCEHLSRCGYQENIITSLLNSHIIPLLMKSFNSSNEAVREEGVRLWSYLVDFFPNHQQLSHFVQLKNKEDDLDFFSNFLHIQLHRRQRGVQRLVSSLRDGSVKIPFDVISRFMMPLLQDYLVNVTSNKAAMSDQCLALLNTILSSAPWGRYISLFDQWLQKLDSEKEREKPIIRILVAIIEAFHYEVAENDEVLLEDKSNQQKIQIREKVTVTLLPKLARCINGTSVDKDVHKKAMTSKAKFYYEDEDIKRAPVALATVKLLQKLPESIKSQHLHGVVLKLCSLMISRSMNVRETARKVTIQVCQCLGAKFLPSIIREMKLIMNKGFQLHVMIYTVHSLIYAMQSHLGVGDLDICLPEIMDLSIQDQFGDQAEEKDVGAIRGNVSEAKSNKTPDTFYLLGKFVSDSAIGIVLSQLRCVIDTKTSQKVINKISTLLSKFAHGLKENQSMNPATQLILIHQVLTTNLEQMEKLHEKKKPDEQGGFRTESCFLLPAEPRRVGALVKTSQKSRVHVFVEFALQLLSTLIVGKCFDIKNAMDIARLDPFVPFVVRCLSLKYDNVIVWSIRCATGMLNMDLPSINKSLKTLTERLFVLLNDYSILGNAANKHSVLQLNQHLFKAFTRIIQISGDNCLTPKHISLLLNYVETDVLDSNKQATAFSLIKAIIKKRIQHKRISEVMDRLSELSITSSLPHIRTQCRETLSDYIGNHPDSGDAQKHIDFFIAQLEFEYDVGRTSAAEMLHQMFNSLLQPVLDDHSLVCVTKLAARLVNEDVVKVRKFIAAALKKLLEGISQGRRDDVYSAACDWMENSKETTRAVGLQVLVQLSQVEGAAFSIRMHRLMKAVIDIIQSDTVLEDNSENTLVSMMDGLVLILQSVSSSSPSVIESPLWQQMIVELSPLVKCSVSCPIRRSSSSLIGQWLSLIPSSSSLPSSSSHASIPSAQLISEWMCWQLRDRMIEQDNLDQVSKNIVFVAGSLTEEQFEELMANIQSICRFEYIHQQKKALRRLSCMKLSAALALKNEGYRLESVISHMMPLIVREMNRKSAENTEELCQMAGEVGEVFKMKIGEEEYNKRLATEQKESMQKTEERKRKLKELAVVAPSEAAELKKQKTAKKAAARKRKLDILKPYRISKRKRIEEFKAKMDEE